MKTGSVIKLDDPLIKDYVIQKVGEEAYYVLSVLNDTKSLKKGKTDEKILKSMKASKKVANRKNLKVNTIRAHLNRLHYSGIIHYTKQKAKTSNWYTYTWFLKKERIMELVKDKFKEELDGLEKQIGFEQNYAFFKCEKKNCKKLPFELAFEYDFKCPECGSKMNSIDSSAEKVKIKRRIEQIKKIIS